MTLTLGDSPRRRLTGAWLAAAAWHGLLLTLLTLLTRGHPTGSSAAAAIGPDHQPLILLIGPGGGGGGGGNMHAERPRRLERAGSDRASVPAPPAPPSPPPSSREPDPVDQMILPALSVGDALASLPGVLGAPPAETLSRGPGSGRGAGDGVGPGSGVGDGPGLDAGSGGGTGGGPLQAGGNILAPIAVHVEPPRYSTDAMRARIQGVVVIECVVRVNGICSDIHVRNSLDRQFGLDEEAKRAAALWRFRPGTRFGEPVPVAVRLEIAFTIR